MLVSDFEWGWPTHANQFLTLWAYTKYKLEYLSNIGFGPNYSKFTMVFSKTLYIQVEILVCKVTVKDTQKALASNGDYIQSFQNK